MLSWKDQYTEITAKVKLAPNGCWMRAGHCRRVLTGCLPEDLGGKGSLFTQVPLVSTRASGMTSRLNCVSGFCPSVHSVLCSVN